MSAVVDVSGVRKTYRSTARPVVALDDVAMAVDAGSLVAVHGRSGSGKTTLLNLIGGLDRADAGSITVCGVDLVAASEADLTELRRGPVAFVFQGFGLLPVLSASENIEVPMRLQGVEAGARAERVGELLDLVGLSERARHRPSELSGGEQQRVAIARALAASPTLLIADEPTGQLDSRTGTEIMSLIRDVVANRGIAVVVATHDATIIEVADRRIELSDGSVLKS